jgi:hypothetical protein
MSIFDWSARQDKGPRDGNVPAFDEGRRVVTASELPNNVTVIDVRGRR